MAIYEVEIDYRWLIEVEADSCEEAFDEASDLATMNNLVVTTWSAGEIEGATETTL